MVPLKLGGLSTAPVLHDRRGDGGRDGKADGVADLRDGVEDGAGEGLGLAGVGS